MKFVTKWEEGVEVTMEENEISLRIKFRSKPLFPWCLTGLLRLSEELCWALPSHLPGVFPCRRHRKQKLSRRS